MHQIAAEGRVILAAAEGEGDMPWRMSRRRQYPHVIANRVVVTRNLGPFGFDHRQYAVAEWRHRRLCVLLGPVIEFVLAEHVARVGKSRHPAAAIQPRVPSDVIDVQMRAHYEIDVLDRKTRP